MNMEWKLNLVGSIQCMHVATEHTIHVFISHSGVVNNDREPPLGEGIEGGGGNQEQK